MSSNNFFSRDLYTTTFYSYVKKSEPFTLNLTKSQTDEVDHYHLSTKKGLNRLIDEVDYENGDPSKYAGKKPRHKIVISDEEQREILSRPLIVFKEPSYKGRIATESPYKWYNLTADQVRYSCEHLDKELNAIKFFADPVRWLINRGIICPSTCSVCSYEHKKYKKNQDGSYVWDCCKESKLIELRGNLSFANKLIEKLPLLLYNWAIYGNIGTLENELGVMSVCYDSSIVHLVFEALRHLCQRTNELFDQKLGTNGKTVELLTFLFKKFVVVIAIELETDLVKFKMLTENNVSTIVSIFKEWFDQSVRLVFFEKKFEMLTEYFKDSRFDKNTDKKDTRFYKALHNLIQTDFDIADHPDLFLSYIHEAVWRHQFGKTPYSTFLFIAEIISVQPRFGLRNRLNLIPFKFDVPIKIDELYYGRFDLVSYMKPPKAELAQEVVLRNVVRCPLCYEPQTFEGLFPHLLKHYRNEKQKYGNVTLGSCKHCFRKASILDTRIHDELIKDGKSNTKEMAFSCKICCIVLKNDIDYIKHLRNVHTFGDMPYGCTLCAFRSSFYCDLIEHWKRYHNEVVKAYCRCCLKIFVDENAGKELLTHLTNHKKVRSKYACGSCALVFVNKEDFNLHYYRDHIIQSKIAFKYTLEKYKPVRPNDVKVILVDDSLPKVTKRTMDGKPINAPNIKTLKGSIKLPREAHLRDHLLRTDYVLVNKCLPMCQECSQPIDVNHYSEKIKKCQDCKFKSHCSRAVSYPCSLHMSGFFKGV